MCSVIIRGYSPTICISWDTLVARNRSSFRLLHEKGDLFQGYRCRGLASIWSPGSYNAWFLLSLSDPLILLFFFIFGWLIVGHIVANWSCHGLNALVLMPLMSQPGPWTHSCCRGQLGGGWQFPLEGCASILRLGWPDVCGGGLEGLDWDLSGLHI